MPFKYNEPVDRVIANTVMSETNAFQGTPCWEWIGKRSANRSGNFYGKLSVRVDGKVKTLYAHRFVLENVQGKPLQDHHVVMHLCNNTICCNPLHLARGTQKQNMKQMVREGRNKR